MQADTKTVQETLNEPRVWFHTRGAQWGLNYSHLSDQELTDLEVDSILGDDPDKVKVIAQHLLEVAERYARYCAYLYEKRARLQA